MTLEPVVAVSSTDTDGDPELRDMTRRVRIGLVLTLPVFALKMGAHLFDLQSARRVTAGPIEQTGGFVLHAEKVGADTLLAQIVRTVAAAHSSARCSRLSSGRRRWRCHRSASSPTRCAASRELRRLSSSPTATAVIREARRRRRGASDEVIRRISPLAYRQGAAARVKGEPAAGVDDIQFHPVEPRSVCLTPTASFRVGRRVALSIESLLRLGSVAERLKAPVLKTGEGATLS